MKPISGERCISAHAISLGFVLAGVQTSRDVAEAYMLTGRV
jgi:hypothetical protein